MDNTKKKKKKVSKGTSVMKVSRNRFSQFTGAMEKGAGARADSLAGPSKTEVFTAI
jgi:hypothetical protein